MSSPSLYSLVSSRPSSRASVSSTSTTQDRKPRIMHSGRGGSGNYRKHKPSASVGSTSSISSTLASASESILLSDTASTVSSSVFTMSSGASSISTAPTSLLSAPGTISSMCSTTLSFKTFTSDKTFLSDDEVILANGREASIGAPKARSGRGGLGTHRKIIEKERSLNELDPLRNPNASALMEEFHQGVAARERALLAQSQLEYDNRVHVGRTGHGNLTKENVIKPPRQKKRSNSIDSPRSALLRPSTNISNIRELITSKDDISLGSTAVTPLNHDSKSTTKARHHVRMKQMLKKLAKRRGGKDDVSSSIVPAAQQQTKVDMEVPIIIIGDSDVHHSDDSDVDSEVVFRTASSLYDY